MTEFERERMLAEAWRKACDERDALAKRVAELESERDAALKLAYIGDHQHPDLTWKSRCEEVIAERDAIAARVAELEAALRETGK